MSSSLCLVLTRPVWQGADDPLLEELASLLARYPKRNGLSIRFVSSPLQVLVPEPEDQVLAHIPKSMEQFGRRLLLATSPATVIAMTENRSLSQWIGQEIERDPSSWSLGAVGLSTATRLRHWFDACGLQSCAVDWVQTSDDSGAAPFLDDLDQRSVRFPEGSMAILLEGVDNQPTLAQGLQHRGFRVCRLPLYQRLPKPMPSLSTLPHEAIAVLVSSSALVEPAMKGLQAQLINPLHVHWLTHHHRIASELSKRLGRPVAPLFSTLSGQEILSALTRLNLSYDEYD